MRHLLLMLLPLLALLTACGDQETEAKTQAAAEATQPAVAGLELVFTYGSEKKDWLDQAVKTWAARNERTADGRPITVTAIPMGSGECCDEILRGSRQPHLISPASGAFITLGNAAAQAASGKPLIGATENLVLSPVVIAMWKPMAERLGWPGKAIGWSDILALSTAPTGWGSIGEPAWGRFRFGHTHPEYSNSGLMALLAELQAGAGTTAPLTSGDLQKPEVRSFVGGIEQAVAHYGSSTGFFAERMFGGGMSAFSATVLYESNVVDAASRNLSTPIVSIYPKEGTFWADHPVGIVQREWVTPAHQDAAKRFIRFLLDKPQQQAALTYGFRPGSTDVPVGAPIDATHGCDATQPTTTLTVPSAPILNDALALWRSVKKPSHITLVLDLSGSMNDDGKIAGARAAAASFLGGLDDRDWVSLLVFNNSTTWVARKQPLASARTNLLRTIAGLSAGGGTALYDAILTAQEDFAGSSGERIAALVVLSDGADTESRATLETVLADAAGGVERSGVRIFAIAYGNGAETKVLKRIAEVSRGKAFSGDTKNIQAVFKDIATFF